MTAIVHLAAPAPRERRGDQLCALCGSPIPTMQGQYWPADCLVTVVPIAGYMLISGRKHPTTIHDAKANALPGAVTCLTGLEPAHA